MEKEYSYEFVKEDGKTKEVKVNYKNTSYSPDDPKKLIGFAEGHEIFPVENCIKIAKHQVEQDKLVQDKKVRKVMLSSEEVRIRKTLDNIRKYEQYENMKKSLGTRFEEQMEREKKDAEQNKRILTMWNEITIKLKQEFGQDFGEAKEEASDGGK